MCLIGDKIISQVDQKIFLSRVKRIANGTSFFLSLPKALQPTTADIGIQILLTARYRHSLQKLLVEFHS